MKKITLLLAFIATAFLGQAQQTAFEKDAQDFIANSKAVKEKLQAIKAKFEKQEAAVDYLISSQNEDAKECRDALTKIGQQYVSFMTKYPKADFSSNTTLCEAACMGQNGWCQYLCSLQQEGHMHCIAACSLQFFTCNSNCNPPIPPINANK